METADASNKLVAILHEINTLLGTDDPNNVGREDELTRVKGLARVAERIANGNVTEEELASVPELLHPATSSIFRLQ